MSSFQIEEKHDGKYLVINVEPCSAIRMTQSDRWKVNPNHKDPRKRQRPGVTKYFAYRSIVLNVCNEAKYSLSDTLDIRFVIPMPYSWSQKKKDKLHYQPHKSRPDIDNLVKGFMDAIAKEDSHVYAIKAIKVYGNEGKIIIKIT